MLFFVACYFLASMFNSRALYPILHHGHTGFCGHNDLPNLRQEHVLEAAVWSPYIRTENDLPLRVCPGHGAGQKSLGPMRLTSINGLS